MSKKEFNGIEVEVRETSDSKQWFMTVEEVAKGYGVVRNTIMMHLKDHADELRDGIEKGVSNIDTLGGRQDKTIIYRDGVIKLGYFIRSKQAKNFRQWATNLIVHHMDQSGLNPGMVLDRLDKFERGMQEMQENFKGEFKGVHELVKGLRDDVDELQAALDIFINEDDEKTIRNLMKAVKAMTGLDGRKVAGKVRASLNLASIYDPPHVRQVVNALKNMLGEGLTIVT